MKFQQLVQRCDSDKVIDKLVELYPDQEAGAEGYSAILEKLKYTQAVASDEPMTIAVQWMEPDEFDNEGYVYVNGTKEGSDESWALEFCPWAEWLDWEVFLPSLAIYPSEEIIAHCLWEMTFLGFEEEEIEEKLDDLTSTVAEIKEGISSDEVFKSLRKKIDERDKEEDSP